MGNMGMAVLILLVDNRFKALGTLNPGYWVNWCWGPGWELLANQLTHRESVHPAPSVGGEFHGHSRGGKWINQGSLRRVSTRSHMEHGFHTAHVEPPRGAGVSLRRLYHVFQNVCRLPWNGGRERKHRAMRSQNQVDHQDKADKTREEHHKCQRGRDMCKTTKLRRQKCVCVSSSSFKNT